MPSAGTSPWEDLVELRRALRAVEGDAREVRQDVDGDEDEHDGRGDGAERRERPAEEEPQPDGERYPAGALRVHRHDGRAMAGVKAANSPAVRSGPKKTVAP